MGGFFAELFGQEADVPELDATGQAIQQLQLEQLQRAGGLQEELQPFQLAQLGFTRDEDGTLRQMSTEERLANLTPQERLRQQNLELLQQRFGQALGPGLPSPGLERDIESQRALLLEDIARRGQLGGTAEAQRRGAFQEASLVARDTARRADISNIAQLGLQLETGQSNLLAQRLAMLRGESTSSLPFIQAGATALQPSLQQQNLGFQSNLFGAQSRQGLFGGLGELAGLGLTGGLSGLLKPGDKLGAIGGSAIGGVS